MSKQQDHEVPIPLLGTESRGESRSDSSRNGVSGIGRPPDAEVVGKASRRRFTAAYKMKILEEVEVCTETGCVGRILRREGLHSSHLANWRRVRRQGSVDGLEKTRGRKPSPDIALQKKLVKLEREVAQLRSKLKKAEIILDVQGKVSGLLGFSLIDGRDC